MEKRTINEIIKTDKNINSDLSNIDIINDEEFINLIKHFLSYIYASNLTVIITGLCYLKMICEKEKDRFEKSIYLLVQSGYISILNDEEFDMTSELLIFCDVNIYKNFLKLAKESDNEVIRQSCKEDLKNDCSYYQERRWYIVLCEEYIEFKRNLNDSD